MGGSSSHPSDFSKDSKKGHKARWRKGEETLAKFLKEGRDTGGFTIKRRDKKEVWKERKERYILKGEKGNDGEQYTPLDASDSKEGAASRAD